MPTSSNALINYLLKEIHAKDGQISFAKFMEAALYHPQFGYYNAENFTLGQHGDFITAPEISPLFAKCMARQSLELFNHLGTGNILELGPGTGRFAFDLLLELEKLGFLPEHYYLYEKSVKLRQKQQSHLQKLCAQSDRPMLFRRFSWLDELPQNFTGLIFANEVLDALPVHCFRIENQAVKEKCVGFFDNQFIWKITSPSSKEFAEEVEKIRDLYGLYDGYESEINLSINTFIPSITNTLKQGLILFVDYGYGQREYYHPQRKSGTLTCFYQHQRHDNPLIMPGSQDITAHVDFTRVVENAVENGCNLAGFTTQAAFLLACGLMEMAAEEEKNLSGTDEFRLHQAIKTLTMPTEMGERIKVMALSKNLKIPLLGFGLQDRRRDL